MFYSWSSEHLLVRMSKIIRLPGESCLTACKWTPKWRLKATCQDSPPTPAEVSRATTRSSAGKERCESTLHPFLKQNFFFFKRGALINLVQCCEKLSGAQLLARLPTAFGAFWHCCSLRLLVGTSPWVTGGSSQVQEKSLTTNKCSVTHSRHSMSRRVSLGACVRVFMCHIFLFIALHQSHRKCVVYKEW